jgi:hypothetical protein
MTTRESSNERFVCRYCGLASAVSHARACECVTALLSERNRLREYLRGDGSADKSGANPTGAGANGRSAAPRVALLR